MSCVHDRVQAPRLKAGGKRERSKLGRTIAPLCCGVSTVFADAFALCVGALTLNGSQDVEEQTRRVITRRKSKRESFDVARESAGPQVLLLVTLSRGGRAVSREMPPPALSKHSLVTSLAATTVQIDSECNYPVPKEALLAGQDPPRQGARARAPSRKALCVVLRSCSNRLRRARQATGS